MKEPEASRSTAGEAAAGRFEKLAEKLGVAARHWIALAAAGAFLLLGLARRGRS